MVQYGVLKDEIVYIPDPGYNVEKVSIADQARVRKPSVNKNSGERLGVVDWYRNIKLRGPKLRRRTRSHQVDEA